DRSGLPLRTLSSDAFVERPRLSPDQLSVVGTRSQGGLDIWVTDLIRESSERKTFDDTPDMSPVWSRDGSRLAYSKGRNGIYAIDVNGGGTTKLLLGNHGMPTSWSGQHVLYGVEKIYLLDLASAKEPIQVGSPNGKSFRGEFSPDGNYIAFDS